ncbi:hypothetical protein PLICRDRAFT_336072 [Plicaturopsis crispa FD-325 SS-3]|uniref:Unplaced genomic scaffold PLICRscaffold_15, whole genome shotgun sequence n=1 Tax=Plicaturopsis crispa FD-325 SS-3 TaxID=944288 RepID=A0A0C9TA96_PLICR|nr:hypothetical protein PLICRDRAFT_336072 [Plicaturopsis crispa FD-325 SS-3]
MLAWMLLGPTVEEQVVQAWPHVTASGTCLPRAILLQRHNIAPAVAPSSDTKARSDAVANAFQRAKLGGAPRSTFEAARSETVGGFRKSSASSSGSGGGKRDGKRSKHSKGKAKDTVKPIPFDALVVMTCGLNKHGQLERVRAPTSVDVGRLEFRHHNRIALSFPSSETTGTRPASCRAVGFTSVTMGFSIQGGSLCPCYGVH